MRQHEAMDGERKGLVTGDDGVTRCSWAGSDPLYRSYHDNEWGRPLTGDDELFEMLILESFQAGLSWLTILRKREAFRAAFNDFRIEAVAGFGAPDVERLMTDAAIVRNRAKIEAAVDNAGAARALGSAGAFSDLLWSFAPEARPARPATLDDVRDKTPESTALSTELKSQGFRFVGPTVMHAFMQAVGMVDDHFAGCAVGVGSRRTPRK